MKSRWVAFLCISLMSVGMGTADTYYVWANSLSDGPGTAWSNAFWTIQGAVDAATNAGDVVLVTNGVHYLSAQIVVESEGDAVATGDGE